MLSRVRGDQARGGGSEGAEGDQGGGTRGL